MKYKSYLLAVLCILIFCKPCISQYRADAPAYSLGLSAFTEFLGLPKHTPLEYINERIPIDNKGFALSFETAGQPFGLFRFSHMLEIGYFHHQDLHQVLFIGYKPALELKLLNTLGAHAILGLSYAHSLPTHQTYSFEGGEYQKKRNLGHPHFMPSLGAGLSLDLFGLLSIPAELFIREEVFGLAPYATDGDFPITLNHKISLGIKLFID